MVDVSIIMGIYNCASTLEDAINSLFNQTYENWQLIMCDDASNDETYKIAKKFSDRFENIILIRNDENMGLNYTLNRCLELVDTEFVARMDGDDISLPTRLEKEINFLKLNKKYSIVSTDMIYFDHNGDWGKSNMKEYPQKKDLISGTPFCHAPCMVRTEAYRKVGGYTVDKKLLRMEDYHLWYKMYAQGYVGHNIKESLYKMRDDRDATKRRKYKFRINEAYVRYLIMKDYNLSKKNLIYILRPLVVGLLPASIYEILHKKRMENIQ